MEGNESFSDTKVSLTLGGETYLLSFGLQAMRRIEEAHPRFNILKDGIPPFEIVPILIKGAIANPKWKTEEEFEEIYDDCTDADALSKVLLAYQNAMGFTDQVFVPVVARMTEIMAQMEAEDKKIKARNTKK